MNRHFIITVRTTCRAGEPVSSNENKRTTKNVVPKGYGQSAQPKLVSVDEKVQGVTEIIDLSEVDDEDVDLTELGDCTTHKPRVGENEATTNIKFPIEWIFNEDAVLLTKEDVRRLQPGRWTSGAIVDFYSLWQQRRLATSNTKGVLIVNNFVWTNIKSRWDVSVAEGTARGGPADVTYDVNSSTVALQRLRKRLNFFEQEHIIMPIVAANHWSVLMISHVDNVMTSSEERSTLQRLPCITHFNSMREYHKDVDVCIRHFLLDEFLIRKAVGGRTTLTAEEREMAWVRFCEGEDFPTMRPTLLRQANTDDCGIFGCHYVQLLCDQILQLEGKDASLKLTKRWTTSWFPMSQITRKRVEILHLIADVIQMKHPQMRREDIIHELHEVTEGDIALPRLMCASD
jgi:Ulp1 family protease